MIKQPPSNDIEVVNVLEKLCFPVHRSQKANYGSVSTGSTNVDVRTHPPAIVVRVDRVSTPPDFLFHLIDNVLHPTCISVDSTFGFMVHSAHEFSIAGPAVVEHSPQNDLHHM